MNLDFNYYRKINGMDDVPDDNGTPLTTERIERMSRYLKNSKGDIIHSFDLYKRQGMLTQATQLRYKTVSQIGLHIFYKKVKEPTLNSLVRGVYADLNTLKTGDYITYADEHSGVVETYMIRNKPEPKRTYEEAYMLFCNETLKWIDKNTKEIHEYPCIMSHDKHSIDINESGILETEKSWSLVYAQANPESLKIQTNDRFIFRADDDLTWFAYEIVDSNPHALNGMIIFKAKKVKVNPVDDDLVNGIANYHSIAQDILPPTQISKITGEPEILLGDTVKYGCIGVNLGEYEWSIEHISGQYQPNRYLMTTSDETNQFYVNAVSTVRSVGSEFDIVLKSLSGIEHARKRIRVVSW